MTPGWNAPQGVENVHTLCAGEPKSDDRGNNMIAGPSEHTDEATRGKQDILLLLSHQYQGIILLDCRFTSRQRMLVMRKEIIHRTLSLAVSMLMC